MATSGSVDFTQTRNEIIYAAFRKLRVFSEGETPTSQAVVDATEELNRMTKSWAAKANHLWGYAEGILFLDTTSQYYSLGATGDRAALLDNAVVTTTTVAAVATDTTITLTSVTGISSGDVIGIILDDGTAQWTTVNGAPVGLVVTLTDAITGAAAIGANVYSYSSLINRPLRITSARLVQSGSSELVMTMRSREQYFELSNKTTSGQPNTFYYDPQLTNGRLYVWPLSSNLSNYIRFTYNRPLEDFDNANDNPDFPVEWFDALVYNLAYRLAPEYGISGQERMELQGDAIMTYTEVMNWDEEIEGIQFIMDGS